MLIGQPKTLADIPALNEAEFVDLERVAGELMAAIAAGAPADVPAAVPLGQFIRIVKTALMARNLPPLGVPRLNLAGLSAFAPVPDNGTVEGEPVSNGQLKE